MCQNRETEGPPVTAGFPARGDGPVAGRREARPAARPGGRRAPSSPPNRASLPTSPQVSPATPQALSAAPRVSPATPQALSTAPRSPQPPPHGPDFVSVSASPDHFVSVSASHSGHNGAQSDRN